MLAIVGFVIAGTGFGVLPMAIVRGLTIMTLFVQVYREQQTGNSQFLTSPLFLLGANALVFFSFVLGISDKHFPGSPFDNIDPVYGTAAEQMIVIFGLTCIALHSLIAAANPDVTHLDDNRLTDKGTSAIVFAAIALIISLVNVVNYVSPILPGVDIRSVAAPMLAFSMMYLVYLAVEAPGGRRLLIVGVILLLLGGLFYVHEGKVPIFMIVAGLLYWFRLKKVSSKKLVVFGLIFVPVSVGLLQVAQMVRVPYYSVLGTTHANPASMIGYVARAKIVLRQAETRYCFQRVIDKHWQQPFTTAEQMFWLKGLVPRVLWPEKPSLSLGRDYSWYYCGSNVKNENSSSITLLGQPVIRGGEIGLLLHGGLLIVGLGGVTWFGRKRDRLSAVTVVALLPWLIDFDQDFALYVANAVKFLLAMLPLYFLSLGLRRRSRNQAL